MGHSSNPGLFGHVCGTAHADYGNFISGTVALGLSWYAADADGGRGPRSRLWSTGFAVLASGAGLQGGCSGVISVPVGTGAYSAALQSGGRKSRKRIAAKFSSANSVRLYNIFIRCCSLLLELGCSRQS